MEEEEGKVPGGRGIRRPASSCGAFFLRVGRWGRGIPVVVVRGGEGGARWWSGGDHGWIGEATGRERRVMWRGKRDRVGFSFEGLRDRVGGEKGESN